MPSSRGIYLLITPAVAVAVSRVCGTEGIVCRRHVMLDLEPEARLAECTFISVSSISVCI